MIFPPPIHALAAESRHPLVFATISGAHPYGFASPEREYARFVAELKAAMHASALPDGPSGRAGLNEPLVRVRMAGRL